MSEQKLTRRQQAELYLQDPKVKRYLDLLAFTEGTEKNGYYTKFGGGRIDDLSRHPNKVWGKTGDGPTSATGRYQFLSGTWNEQAKLLGLEDFSPNSQDLAAVSLMMRRGAIKDILNGDIDTANRKLSKEWASLPYNQSPHQSQKTTEQVLQKWEELGGKSYAIPSQQYDYSTTNPQPIASVQSPMQSTQGNREEWLGQQPQKAETQQNNPLSAFTDHFNQLNNTLNAFQPQETPIDNQTKYQKELAAAFGVEPSTDGIIPDYIGDMVRSIYDAQA
ncbi:glycoside hydrolase family 24 protein [Ursidibacter arcticus]